MEWNLSGDRPIWLQLSQQLARRILVGAYPPGSRLPSVRELAAEAGVNPNTMQRALAQLEQDGLAERQPDPADHRKTLVRVTPAGYAACQQCEAALGDYFTCVIARLTPEQAAQMDVLRNVLMDAILAENASREANQPKGEPNHDEDL